MSSTVWVTPVPGRNLQLRWLDEFGKEQRRSSGTKDPRKAERIRREWEARLLLSKPIPEPKGSRKRLDVDGPDSALTWLLTEYDTHRLKKLRPKSRANALQRIKLCLGLMSATTVGEAATRKALADLQSEIAKGRSPWTVKTTLDCFLSMLRWAEREEWIDRVPRIDRIKTSRLKAMKGRPVTDTEFARILAAVSGVVGELDSTEYARTLRGYWESGLRREELLSMAWNDPEWITPSWDRGRHPVLIIPAHLQKSDTAEEIPLLPGFEQVLLETPPDQRKGWCFNPQTRHHLAGRETDGRQSGERLTRLVAKISEAAGVVVRTSRNADGQSVKHFANIHDLRRSCSQRLLLAGVDREVIKAVMRHRSWETTERHYAPGSIQKVAADLRACLKASGTPYLIDHQKIPT